MREPHQLRRDALIGKMSGRCAYVEAPKGSVARGLRRESSSTIRGKLRMGVGVGRGVIR
jgi:hypothetical protein